MTLSLIFMDRPLLILLIFSHTGLMATSSADRSGVRLNKRQESCQGASHAFSKPEGFVVFFKRSLFNSQGSGYSSVNS